MSRRKALNPSFESEHEPSCLSVYILYTCLVPPWRDFTETEQSFSHQSGWHHPAEPAKCHGQRSAATTPSHVSWVQDHLKDIFHPNMAQKFLPRNREDNSISRGLDQADSQLEIRASKIAGLGLFAAEPLEATTLLQLGSWSLSHINTPWKLLGKLILSILCVCMLPLLSEGMGSGRTLDHRYFKNTILDCIWLKISKDCPDLSSI